MDQNQVVSLKHAYRNGWILIFFVTVFVILFFTLIFVANYPGKQTHWDMGGKPFVPASSVYATGYFAPAKAGFNTSAKETVP
jgi:hypothetical protein